MRTILLGNELSSHLPVYLWGPKAVRVFETLRKGYALGCMARLLAQARAVYRDPAFDHSEAASVVVANAQERAADARETEEARIAQLELTAREAEQRVRRAARGAEREELLAQLEELGAWYRDLVAFSAGAKLMSTASPENARYPSSARAPCRSSVGPKENRSNPSSGRNRRRPRATRAAPVCYAARMPIPDSDARIFDVMYTCRAMRRLRPDPVP